METNHIALSKKYYTKSIRAYDLQADKKEIKESLLTGPDGFDSSEEVLTYLDTLGVDRRYAVIIRYKGKYYASLRNSVQKEVVIGSDKVWFMKHGYFLSQRRDIFKMPYAITRRDIRSFEWGIVEDMLKEDPDLMTYSYGFGELVEWEPYIHRGNSHLVLLGLTFKDKFYSRNEVCLPSDINPLKRYFYNPYFFKEFVRKEGIEFLNPFKALAAKNGKLFHYRIITSPYELHFSL
jgi:hypothetical protein